MNKPPVASVATIARVHRIEYYTTKKKEKINLEFFYNATFYSYVK